jgi:hypothetical protein
MAFADYFNKNIQSAALLLQGIDADAFKAVLEREVVCLAFDDAAANSFEGQATLDLLVRSLGRLYPAVTFLPSGMAAKKHASALQTLARAVNKNIDIPNTLTDVTRCLVVGDKRPKFPLGVKPFLRFVGSENWFARISAKGPVGSGSSKNPFGAGGAACIGAANVFRTTFAQQLPGSKTDDEAVFSMLEFAPTTKKSPNPTLPKVDFGDLHLAGNGAIANGFLWAASRLTAASGDLHVVDHQKLEKSNLQRYVMTVESDEDEPKVELAERWLLGTGIKVKPHAARWEDYVAERNDWRFERVAIAVDTAETRINIQAALPRHIHNSWTQSGEAGASRHGFLGPNACLACLYMPTGAVPSYDRLIAEALGFPPDQPHLEEIRRRLDLHVQTERNFLERVAAARTIPVEKLLPFEGKSLEALYVEAVCSGAVMELANPEVIKRIEVPMAFQSAFAGLMLAADVVAEVGKLRKRLPTMTQVRMLSSLPELPSSGQGKAENTRCMCVDQDFIDAYKAKYDTSVDIQG